MGSRRKSCATIHSDPRFSSQQGLPLLVLSIKKPKLIGCRPRQTFLDIGKLRTRNIHVIWTIIMLMANPWPIYFLTHRIRKLGSGLLNNTGTLVWTFTRGRNNPECLLHLDQFLAPARDIFMADSLRIVGCSMNGVCEPMALPDIATCRYVIRNLIDSLPSDNT